MGETWTVLKVLQWTAGYLKQKDIDNGRLEGELLLADTLGMDRVGLYLNYDRPLNREELAAFRENIKRRANREPLQYILGKTEFWSLPVQVNQDVLIPRADTEVLVEEALKVASPSSTILDVGTGSGAIALALAHELAEASVEGLDISARALAVATENAKVNGLEQRIKWQQGDLLCIETGPYDLVVSNPPYIPQGDMEKLMPEVRCFEPHEALSGGVDGLDYYRVLAKQAKGLLNPGGWILLEVGIDQAEKVQDLLSAAGLQKIYQRKDYAGIPRVVGGQKAA